MHDPVSPLRAFDEGSWLFRQMVQAQPFIRQVRDGPRRILGLLLALGLGYLCWQEGSRWYAAGAGLALLGSLLLVVVRHNYDSVAVQARPAWPAVHSVRLKRNIPLPYRAPFMAARKPCPRRRAGRTLGQSFLPPWSPGT
ncbi:hypothetical protein ACPA9J_30765 [Pseudomonas aeruginosa]